MDAISSLFLTLGIALLAISWLLLLITSSNEDFAWGLCSLLLPPLSYLYGLWRWDKTRDAITLAAVGWLLVWLACIN